MPHAQTHASNAHLEKNVNTLVVYQNACMTKQFLDLDDSNGIQLILAF